MLSRRRLIVVGVLFVIVIMLVFAVIPYRRQANDLDHIENAGGLVTIKPVGPMRLRNLLGEGRMRGFDKIVRLEFVNGGFRHPSFGARGGGVGAGWSLKNMPAGVARGCEVAPKEGRALRWSS